jgi:hypothetical protein
MKQIKRVIALFLALTLGLLVFASCASNDQQLYDKVYTYLNEKYKGVEFQINGYVQDVQTSGKYTFDVTCLTTETDFEVIMSSLLVSDSYLVAHANKQLRDDIFELFGSARSLICLGDAQCFDHYLADGSGYRFNEDVELTSYTVDDLTDIFRVTLTDIESSGDAAQCVYMFCDILALKGIVLDKVTFSFVLNEEQILFTTNTNTIEALASFEPLEELFEKAKSPSGLNHIFYREPGSDTKIITYITD